MFMAASSSSTASTALALLLAHDDDDFLSAFFASLSPRLTAMLAQVCKRWACAGELCLRGACIQQNWALPRRARLQQRAKLANVPWRHLFVQRACRACMRSAGDFAARLVSNGAPAFFLCGACAKESAVVEKLQLMRATLDVTGLTGKPLYTRRQSAFCSDVSRLSKAAIDHAHGDRGRLGR